MFDIIAFDADDTLWHNEILYNNAQDRLQELLVAYHLDGQVKEELFLTEMQNLHYYGYGIKGFALSMVETAVRITGGRIQGREILAIIDLAQEMVLAPVQLLDHVADVIPALSASYTLMLVTKGDLFDQERKIAQSGLASHFAYVEIVSEKSADVYRALLKKHRIGPRRFLMVGNSLRSDVLPVIALGGHAVHIPYRITWQHEAVSESDESQPDYVELEHIGLLPDFLQRIERQR